MIHLTPQQISSFLDGELMDASTEIVRLHLVSCEKCTLAFARAEEQGERLARVLMHDPGAEYFEVLADEVEQLIRTGKVEPRTKPRAVPVEAPRVEAAPEPETAKREPEPATPRPEPAMSEPPRQPRPAPEPEPAVHPAPEPVVKPVRAVRRRESDRRPVPAIPWYAAAILVVIAGSVGVMVSRTPLLSPPPEDAPPPAVAREPESGASGPSSVKHAAEEPLPVTGDVRAAVTPEPRPVTTPEPTATQAPIARAPIPEAPAAAPATVVKAPPKKTRVSAAEEPALLVPEPMKTLMPVTRVVTVVETTQTAAASASPAMASRSLPKRAPAVPTEPDPFATLLSELLDRVRAARYATARANEDPTALNYETAATRWDDVVTDLKGHAAQPRARYQLASARFHAWEMHPNPQRAASALASLRLYLVFASPGAERDSAKAWLARLGH